MAKDCRFCQALTAFGDELAVAEIRMSEGSPSLHIGGKKPTPMQLINLKTEVELLKKTELWKIMTSTVSQHAIKLGIKDAKDFDQTLFAKSMLHVVGLIEGVLTAIEEAKPIEQVKK